MSCTVTRIDHLDFNTASSQVNPAHAIYDATRQKIYFVYCNFSTVVTKSENYAVYFREYDPLANTFLAAVAIDTPGDTKRADRASMVRLTTGRLIVAYSVWNYTLALYQTYAKESSDNGVTWSAGILVDNVAATSRQFIDMGSDGTNVCLFTFDQSTFSGSPPGKSLFYFKRTGVDTWNTSVTVRDGHVDGAAGECHVPVEGAKRMVIVVDAQTQMILMDRANGSISLFKTSCFRTTDGGGSWTEILVKDHGADTTYHSPHCEMGSDGRIRAMWLKTAGITLKPEFGYSDDDGLTWTVVGTPAVVDYEDNDAWRWWNTGFELASDDTYVVSTWTRPAPAALWTIHIYRGGDTLSGWTEIATCDVGAVNISNLLGDSLLAGPDFYHIVDPILTAGSTRFSLAFLKEEDVIPPGGGGPPLVEEAPSGIDQPNMYLRLDIADDRGWSAHQVQVNCFAEWPEGDYTTERRKPEILGAVSSIDANMQDVAILPAYWKIDDPERWGKEALVANGDGTYAYVDDPFLFRWYSEDMNIGESGSQNVMRAVYLKYRRPSQETFTVEVWIDGQLADTEDVPADPGPTGEPAEWWWPIPRSTNVGSRIQLRIEDRERIDLTIEEFSIKFRPKHWRMRG